MRGKMRCARWHSCVRACRKAQRLGLTLRNQAVLWVDMGHAFLALGQAEDAAYCSEQALKEAPWDPQGTSSAGLLASGMQLHRFNSSAI